MPSIETKQDRVLIAEETIQVINNGFYKLDDKEINIEQDIKNSIQKSKLYTPKANLKIEITKETTLSCCKRLLDEGEENICALNFASATHPGGGFLRGSVAQEEHLCYNSALYASLKENTEYYNKNIALDSALWTHHAIYSPNVPVFRNDNGEFIYHYPVSFITSPAPNLNQTNKIEHDAVDLDELPFVSGILNERIGQILTIASQNNHKVLVLGSFGCGAFFNSPSVVARLFALNLSFFRFAFDRVVFAIYDRPGKENSNFNVFSSIIKQEAFNFESISVNK